MHSDPRKVREEQTDLYNKDMQNAYSSIVFWWIVGLNQDLNYHNH